MKRNVNAALSLTLVGVLAGCGGGGGTTPIIRPTTMPLASTALWVANGANVLEFLPSQLIAGVSDPAPHIALNSASGLGAPQGVQFDANGNLWVLDGGNGRSEEHTSELQSLRHLVCRLLLEKKKQAGSKVRRLDDPGLSLRPRRAVRLT